MESRPVVHNGTEQTFLYRFQSEIDCLVAHQLFSDLSEQIAEYQSVVFVGAADGIDNVVDSEITSQKTSNSWSFFRHSPLSLISAASVLTGSVPSRCYLIEIPAFEFDYGNNVSFLTAHMPDKGVEVVNNILQHHTCVRKLGASFN